MIQLQGDSLYSAGIGYIHDTQCILYNGPDDQYKDKEIISSAEGAVVITDVDDKNNPQTLSTTSHPDMGYSHQGWLTEDHRYFLMNDELMNSILGVIPRLIFGMYPTSMNPLF